MEQIKDQQRLFEKLFQSPACPDPPHHLILSMQFLKLLLEELPQLTWNSQKSLIQQILALFKAQPANSLLLYHQDLLTADQTPLLTLIVMACAKSVRTNAEIDELLPQLDLLLRFYPVGLLQISSLTRQLSLMFQQGQFNAVRTRFLHLMLQRYYGNRPGFPSYPSYFFMYARNETSTIHSLEDSSLKLKNEVAIMFSFLLLQQPAEDLVLCRFISRREEITLRAGKGVSVVNETTKESMNCNAEIKALVWYRVLFNLSSNQTAVFLNCNLLKESKGLMRKDKEIQLQQYSFGEQLFGFITGIAIADKLVSTTQINDVPELKAWTAIASLKDKKLSQDFALGCFPFSTFEMRDNRHCFDVFRKSHTQIGENVIVYKDNSETIGISQMGGYEVMLPLFYLARFYTKTNDPDHLERILSIWLASIERFKDGKSQKMEQFLLILGHHLQALPDLLTEKCVTILTQIYDRLSPPNKTLFLKHVGWSGLPGHSSGSGVINWLNWLTKLYQNNKSQCLLSFNLLDVVFWLVKNLQNNQQHCCPQHYLSQARVLREFSLEELINIEQTTKKQHFAAVQNIAAVILEYYIIDHEQQALREVKGILRLLLHKYSNCLYVTILRILKRQLSFFRQDQYIADFLLKANILPFLAALAQKVVDPGLLSLVIHLMILIGQRKEQARSQIVNFIAIVFKRLQDIHNHKFNLLAYGAKKIRKKSSDLTSPKDTTELSSLIKRMEQYREDLNEIKFLLINFCLGTLCQYELTSQNRFTSEDGFYLLRGFIPLTPTPVRLELMVMVLAKLQQNPNNYEFCLKSVEFNRMLLAVLGDVKLTGGSALNPKLQQVIICIMVELMRWQLVKQFTPADYYLLLKNLSRSQISLVRVLSLAFNQLISQQHMSVDQMTQILLIMTYECDIAGEKTADYYNLIESLIYNVGKIIKHKFLTFATISQKNSSSELIGAIRRMGASEFRLPLFELQINPVMEEQITFLFDIFLPKIIAGFDVSPLLVDFKRQVYAFEIYIYKIMDLIDCQVVQSDQLLTLMVEVIIVFMSTQVLRKQSETNKSFMRMTLFLTSHSLAQIHNKRPLLLLWNFIISLLRQQAVMHQAHSYEQLTAHMLLQGIQPYFVEIFDVFLRSSNDKQVLPFQQLMTLDSFEQTQSFILENLVPIFLNGQFIKITRACQRYAYSQVDNLFKPKLMLLQARMDSQQKKPTEQKLFYEVERIFQQESIGEEETRLRYLHEHECSLRQYHSSWNKLWKKLRLYHHPYGLFFAQKNNSSNFLFESTKLKNIRFKMSKYSSFSGIQPILEAQVQEPWHACKLLKQENRNQISSLVQMMKPSHNHRKKTEGVISNLAGLFKKRMGKERQKEELTPEYEVLWIKRGRKARGKLMLNDRGQLVFWYETLKQEDSHLSFERFSLPFNKLMVKSWRIDYIKQISRRRYLMNYHALQITLISRKSLLFHFCTHSEDHFLQQMKSIRMEKIQSMAVKLKLNKVAFYNEEWLREGLSPKIVDDWRNRRISNMTYLVEVNRAASRGIYDISQYPVFPWVCEVNDEKQPVPRDLTKTMGGLGSEERRKIVKEKYAIFDPFNPVPPFHFGTHYSSPGVVFNFLIRLAPFTEYCKNLQGGKFDIPDRLFSSLVSAWRSAYHQVSDVRELLPEFFYLPQCLVNLERLNLGLTQNGQTVDSVLLPPWAADNPYFLTTQLRQMLQSEQTSATIGNWIDLIFGFKQNGDLARDSYNVYYYLTYEGYSNCLTNQSDQVYRKSCEAQVIHFGQIPPQIFEKEHPKRNPPLIGPVELRVTEKIQLMNSLKQRLVGALRVGNEVFLLKRNEIHNLSIARSPAVLTRSVIEFNFQRTISKQFFNMKKEAAKVLFFGRSFFAVYGYTTNEFRVFNRNSGAYQYGDRVDSKIDSLLINKQETLILVGCSSGLLHIFELQYDVNKITGKKIHTQIFPHSVAHLSQNDAFYAVSFGCYVAIYKFERSLYYLEKRNPRPFVRFFRSFKNGLPVKAAFIADSPLYSLLLCDNAHVKVYSINGQFIKSLPCNPKAVFRMKDRQLNTLFCLVEQNRLMLLSTPDLRCMSEMELGGALQVFQGMVVYERELKFFDCI